MDLFAVKKAKPLARVQEIKTLIAATLGLDADTAILVTELACEDADCPDVETVIAVMKPPATKLMVKSLCGIAQLSDAAVKGLCDQLVQAESLASR